MKRRKRRAQVPKEKAAALERLDLATLLEEVNRRAHVSLIAVGNVNPQGAMDVARSAKGAVEYVRQLHEENEAFVETLTAALRQATRRTFGLK
jgi:hypothetical protein